LLHPSIRRKENVAPGVVHPVLFPPLQRRIVDVVALSRISDVPGARPIFLHNAILEDSIQSAVSAAVSPLLVTTLHSPSPEVKLTIFRRVRAGFLLCVTISSIFVKRASDFSSARSYQSTIGPVGSSHFGRLFPGAQMLYLISFRSEDRGDAVLGKLRRQSQGSAFFKGLDGFILLSGLI